jgi:ATP-dependent DNA helicase RecG
MDLQSPLIDAGRVYKMYASRLEKLGIYTFEDFLYYLPFRYDNFSLISKIGQVQAGEVVTVQGNVLDIKNIFTKTHKSIQKATIADETGSIELTWFNQPFLTRNIKLNDTLSVSGKVDMFAHRLTMQSPEYEILNGNGAIHTGRLVPIYSETKGVSSKWLRRQTYKLLLEYQDQIQEYMPEEMLHRFNFMPLLTALKQAHFPASLADAIKAKERLAFDELFFIQLKAMLRRAAWQKQTKGNPLNVKKHEDKIKALETSLPFELTNAQKRALHDILKNLTSETPMNRLLQGDVGSGKTIVAAFAIYLAYLNGYQSVLMAPTEILAQQHFATIERLLSPFGMNVRLVTGTKKFDAQKEPFDILVGTHAVLSKNVQFDKLGLVVIDEQQRFGVAQRSIIREKGKNPHLLTMTATPIPRTVALTMYGDLELSYLDEMPGGRKRIKTWLVPPEKKRRGI